MPKDYTNTLNLPKTNFSMRANLPQREPEMQKKYEDNKIYHKLQKKNEGKPSFILHDGPPFSNNSIHMGTALNKILKDFIVKYKSMTGFYAPYVPGWDNHGMPIESAIIKMNKLDRKKMSISEFRSRCHEFAQKYVNVQMEQFKRLGVFGDWDNPYLTMNPEFEAIEVEVFGEMYKRGYIYKGLKPVYWCPKDETALAEAEIEYSDVPSDSIYVKFKVTDGKGLTDDLGENTYFIIWTTTPWTLPGNLAIAVHPFETYVAVKAGGEVYIIADALVNKTMADGKVESYEKIKSFRGSDLEFIKTKHPFLDRESVVINAEYVTMENGTGCVHIAPGFGAEDYQVCRQYNIDIIVPVDDRGYQTEEAGKFAGMFYEESNEAIMKDMQESGALFARAKIMHSYPHCWRCKNPIIFRATPQWFCSVEAFKDESVKACREVDWIPAWGEDRIVQMVKDRADWCISRQRHWGLPIPVFYCNDCKKPVCTDETIKSVSKIFKEFGSNAWYDKSAEELLPEGFVCPHCGGKHFTKETDTLDGWFDSGSTHIAVMQHRKELSWPADLYLEGADQYRGWFQSSLLTSIGSGQGSAPYRQVLTHGWVVDGEGKAMHKSLGNAILPEEMIEKYGADIVRLWVASSDYQADIRASDLIFKQLSETYRKIRNTARIILANIGDDGTDFNPDTDIVPLNELFEIDKWALSRLNRLVSKVREAYDNYEFHIVSHEINNFCTIDMSKLYIDITKDRVYVEKKDSKARRSAQTVMYIILSALTRLLAPILAFTSDEIWQAMPHVSGENKEHVLLNDIPTFEEKYNFAEIEEKWNKLFDIRDDVMKALEIARADKLIGKSLEAKVELYTTDSETYNMLSSFVSDLSTVFIVSKTTVTLGEAPANAHTSEDGKLSVVVSEADGHKCDRCWMHSTEGELTEDGFVCERCLGILNS